VPLRRDPQHKPHLVRWAHGTASRQRYHQDRPGQHNGHRTAICVRGAAGCHLGWARSPWRATWWPGPSRD